MAKKLKCKNCKKVLEKNDEGKYIQFYLGGKEYRCPKCIKKGKK